MAEAFKAARVAVVEGLREEICRSQINLRDPSFIAYLVAQTRGAEENLHAVFLDHLGCYLRDERVVNGDWATISVRLRPLFRRTVEISAAKIVLCHNHPSGNPNPSQQDIKFTREVEKVSRSLGIELVDHLIVSGSTVFSMRTAGFFK
ncbi:MAG: JAB domain-containing protein [Novosphingobium sp.]